MREISLSPELVGVCGGRVARRRGRGESGMLIRVGTSLRKPHPLVQASRPE